MPGFPRCPCSPVDVGPVRAWRAFPLLLGRGPWRESSASPALGVEPTANCPEPGALPLGLWPALCHQLCLTPRALPWLHPSLDGAGGTRWLGPLGALAAHLLLLSRHGWKARPQPSPRPGRRDGALSGERVNAVSCLQGVEAGSPCEPQHSPLWPYPPSPAPSIVCVCLSVLAPPASRPLLGSSPFSHGLWGCESTPSALAGSGSCPPSWGWQQGSPSVP